MTDNNNSSASGMQLTSTTAPGKVFFTRSELADHYKSDWHKYNLKRREMNMDMLTYEAFHARLEAALALKKEREIMEERSGKDHLKDKDKKNDKKNKKKKNSKKNKIGSEGHKVSKRHLRQEERNGGVIAEIPPENLESDDDTALIDEQMDHNNNEAPPVIDPKQCLFDSKIFPDVQSNVDYMYQKYGFFIPDIEYLIDLEGLIGYCAEKIKLGHTCLCCQKTFSTWEGCQKHMIQTRHTKLKYEAGIDLEEFDVFYDFTEDDVEFLNSGIGNYKKKQPKKKKQQHQNGDEEDDDIVSSKMDAMAIDDDDDDDDDSGEWEDIDSDEEMDDEKDNGLYAAYQDEIAQHGLDITPLGELIFPDGRIIGHRGLSRYYKQRITLQDSRTSVVAARRANRELLYEGRVYDTHDIAHNKDQGQGRENSIELVKAGLSIGATRGRAGNGILVPANGSISGGQSGTSYTALSLYRYKAAIEKTKREEFKARRLQQRTTLPMNKMDKKWNRLNNNVSVAHAPR